MGRGVVETVLWEKHIPVNEVKGDGAQGPKISGAELLGSWWTEQTVQEPGGLSRAPKTHSGSMKTLSRVHYNNKNVTGEDGVVPKENRVEETGSVWLPEGAMDILRGGYCYSRIMYFRLN